MRRSSPAGARDLMRARNQLEVFEEVHLRGPVSRAEIATTLHLSPATVTNITGDLIARGLLYEAREAEANGVGRRAILLEVNYTGTEVAGVKLSNAGITCAISNLNAEVSRTGFRPLTGADPAGVVEAVRELLEELDATAIAALGISLPGMVGEDSSTVVYSPLLGWQAVPFGRLLEEHLAVPVTVENDVNALALAEAWFGYGRGHESFLVVTLGRGVGLGIVLGGEVYRGPRGGAGEFGHIVLDPAGPDGAHAGRGTVEAYLSDDALLEAARTDRLQPEPGDIEALTSLALSGNEAAIALFAERGKVLGRALSILVNVFAPSLIILSGEGMRAADVLLPATLTELERVSFGELGRQVELIVHALGDDAWARGAASLAASSHLVREASRTGGDPG